MWGIVICCKRCCNALYSKYMSVIVVASILNARKTSQLYIAYSVVFNDVHMTIATVMVWFHPHRLCSFCCIRVEAAEEEDESEYGETSN